MCSVYFTVSSHGIKKMNCIDIIRDFKDTCISFWFWRKKRQNSKGIKIVCQSITNSSPGGRLHTLWSLSRCFWQSNSILEYKLYRQWDHFHQISSFKRKTRETRIRIASHMQQVAAVLIYLLPVNFIHRLFCRFLISLLIPLTPCAFRLSSSAFSPS